MNNRRTAASIRRSYTGARSRAEGEGFEHIIEKTPEPMRPIGSPDRAGRFLACWYNVIDETKIVSSQTVIWLCRFPKHSNIEVLTGAESGKIACLVSIQELLTV